MDLLVFSLLLQVLFKGIMRSSKLELMVHVKFVEILRVSNAKELKGFLVIKDREVMKEKDVMQLRMLLKRQAQPNPQESAGARRSRSPGSLRCRWC